ncbi:VOC family protein [Pseudonocardia kujensis]|uniref:VOC family protein n=1 Tax=Pseudonocardia kujensis TaxID=1128675 RepID=UPI001E5881BC|nr:VOC family protein [Pseudonocardia kujensis]MCE0766877.1 VOC family protein [Pseudonocardia kujensis]
MTSDQTTSAELGAIAQGPLGLPLSHVCFRVPDLRAAVDFWARAMHAGPFFLLENVEFDFMEYEGEPAIFEHSGAFGQWGDIAVELQQLHRVEPEGLRRRLEVPMNHVSYIAEDGAAASAELEAAGMPLYMVHGSGPILARFHSVPTAEHSIEIHQSSDFLNGFFEGVERAARGWQGENPLRVGPPPGVTRD